MIKNALVMLADAEIAIGYFLAMLVAVLIPTCIGLIECQRGRYGWTLVVFAWVPVIFAVCMVGSVILEVVSDLLNNDPGSVDFGVITFTVALSAPFFFAGWWTLSRLKQNRIKRN